MPGSSVSPGMSWFPAPEEADLAVINTCTVTVQADADSRQKLRHMARSGVPQIVATGCWATLHPEEAAALPAIHSVVPNDLKDLLVPDLLQLPRRPLISSRSSASRCRAPACAHGPSSKPRMAATTTVLTASPPWRAARDAASPPRSCARMCSPPSAGARRRWCSPAYTLDRGDRISTLRRHLSQLVQDILTQTDIPRLRLSSLEPWDLDQEFFELWQDPRLCRHLHLPLQSGCAATLRRMARKTTPEAFAALLASARLAIPSVAITTDIMVGFPGEDEAEFAESLAFVQAMQFAAGHVFTFSERPGTAAVRLPDQVPHPVRKQRSAQMRQALAESAAAYRARFVGCTLPVLWESTHGLGPQGWELSGLTDNYLRVTAQSPEPLWNRITEVTLTGMTEDGLQGQFTNS